ncbi:MAG TPA: homocysteine S-methyltransferase family protein, partial [Nitrospirales bacterium]|nr:homocysteine S-methyltransferase family protein [Nitrospirales bacterium]
MTRTNTHMRATIDQLHDILTRRIAIIDGAMGTMIQTYDLDEAGYRGAEFARHPRDLKGCNDLLCLTRPEIIEAIHRQYLEAGADIIESNTFNSTSISMADYGLEARAYDLNVAGARVARRAVDSLMARDGRPRFVAGALGPTNRTASLSPDVNNPAYRAVTFDQLVEAYGQQVSGLLDGGADLLLCETVFDTLNLKAALFAIDRQFEQIGRRVPVMVSVTITDRSGRTLSGQTIEAFWNSISHMPLLSVGINCAFGAPDMRPYVDELSAIAPVYLSCYPNAGLPNAFGGFDETPERMAKDLGGFATNGWLNIVGGCCGSTPAHIQAIAEAVRSAAPRRPPTPEPYTRLSGLEPLTIRPETNFVNIGERTNVTGSPKFSKLILAGEYEPALGI